MPRSGLLRGACVAAALALTVVAGSAAGSPAGRTAPTHVLAKPRWQQLPGLDHGHGSGLATSGWAAGRAWFVVGSQQRLTVASARTGGGLAAQKTTQVRAPYGWDPIFLDSELLYSRAKGASGIAPLLANGGLGPAEAPSQEPMAHEVGPPVAATRTGGRIVWALAGGVAAGGGGNYKPTLWACCDATDAARDLTSLITQVVSSPPRAHALEADTQGRLWLAWIDGRPQQQELRVVQLDATTLMPRTRKALVAPVTVLGPATRTQDVALTCAASCRVVTGSFVRRPSGGIDRRLVTWAPGERSATVLRLPGDESRNASLVGASYRAGKLAVAYLHDSPDSKRWLKVVEADARGRNARPAGSTVVASTFRGLPLSTFYTSMFAPPGLVFAQEYSNYGRRAHVLATVVPLR